MERLTERTADGILVKENYEKESLKTLYSCYGEKPNPHYANCEEGYCAMEKLADYEDLGEQGRLVKLPCNDVYFIIDINNHKYAMVMKRPIRELTIYEIENIDKSGCKYFSTEEKAEAKLKELRGGENGSME